MRVGVANIQQEQMGLSTSSIALPYVALQTLPEVLSSIYTEYVRVLCGGGQAAPDYEKLLSPEKRGYRVKVSFDQGGQLNLTREWNPSLDP
jgi:hypothetical protein